MSRSMSQSNLNKIRRRLGKASPGPWAVAGPNTRLLHKVDSTYVSQAEDFCVVRNLGHRNVEVLGCSEWLRVSQDDLAFIANARQDLQDLVAEVDRLNKLVKSLKEVKA